MISTGRYLLGVVTLAITLGGVTLAARALLLRFAADLDGPLRVLAVTTAALALLILTGELLGTVGLFRLGPLTAVAGLAGAAGWRAGAAPPRTGRTRDAGRPRIPPPSPGALAAALAAAAVIAEWLTPSLASLDTGIRSFDSLWYHLPWAASFAQTGDVASLRFTDIEYLTPFYPASGELLHGVGIVLLGRDVLSPLLNLGFLAGTLLAAWCIGRPRGVAPATLAAAAAALALPMVRFSQAGSAANDTVGIFCLLAAAAFVLAARDRAGARPLTVLAALACGLAIGTKLSLLAPAAGLAAGAILWPSEPPEPGGGRRRARLGALRLWLPALLLSGGYWYARNLIVVGNPLPWVDLPGLAVPAPPLQADTASTVAHYIAVGTGWSRWFLPGLRDGLGPLWPAVVAVALAGPVALLLRGPDATARMLAGVALLALAAYLVTPESAAGPAGRPSGFAFNLRYAAPGLTLAFALAPLALPARALPAPSRNAAAGAAAAALLLALTVARPALWPGGYTPTAILVTVVLGGLVALAVVAVPRTSRRAAAALVLAAGLAVVVAGLPGERHYLAGRYRYAPHVSALAAIWDRFRTIRGARVALTGTFGGFFAYPLFGRDLSDRVVDVGRHGPHASFGALGSCTAYRRALASGRYTVALPTPDRDPWRPAVLTASREQAWAASDPEARPLLRSSVKGQAITVYALSGRFSTVGCPNGG